MIAVPERWTTIAVRGIASGQWDALPNACVRPDEVEGLKNRRLIQSRVERGRIDALQVRAVKR